MKRILRSRKSRAFTLVEILVVISIIIILVGTVLALGTQLRANAQIKQTKMTLQVCRTALQKYLDEGNPESALQGVTGGPPYLSNATAQTSFATVFHSIPSVWKGIQGISSGTSASGSVVDGFGNSIQYVKATDGPGFFQSAGPDGQFGTADDMFSYDP